MWLYWIGTPVGLVPEGMAYLYMVVLRGMIILCHWGPAWPSPLRCCHVGLVNPNMVASCSIREYMKSKKRRKMVKALKSTSKWEIVGVDTYMVECLLYHVMWILIVGHIYNFLLVTDVYCLFSVLMAHLWWPCYDALVYDLTLSSGDIIDRHYRWWSFYALHTGGMSESLELCNNLIVLTLPVVYFSFRLFMFCV